MSFFPKGQNPEPMAPGIYNNPNGIGAKVLDVDETLPNDVYILKTLKQGAGMTITEGPNDITLTSSGSGAAEVNDLLDGYHVGSNMSVGQKLVAPSGTGNTVISVSAPSLTSGIDNTIVGDGAGLVISTQTGNTLVGADAGSNVQNSNNTVVGADSLTGAVTGVNGSNTVLGQGAGNSLTTGFNNVLVGRGTNASAAVAGSIALGRNTTGTGANAIKNNALYLPPNYVDNTEALVKPMVYDPITGECGTFPLGLAGQVLATNATTDGVEWVNDASGTADVNGLLDGYHVGGNIAVGAKPTTYTGTNNVHVTGTALPATVGGSFNVGVGDQSLSNASLAGSNNVQLGFGAGNGITTGNRNINLGSTNSVTTGSDNIQMGQSAIVNPTGSNQIALGQGASCTQNNSLAFNTSLVAPTTSNKLVTFDTTTGEMGPRALMSADQVMGQNSAGTALEAKSIVAGTGITVNHTAGQIEVVNSFVPYTNDFTLYLDASAPAGGDGSAGTPWDNLDDAITAAGSLPAGSYSLRVFPGAYSSVNPSVAWPCDASGVTYNPLGTVASGCSFNTPTTITTIAGQNEVMTWENISMTSTLTVDTTASTSTPDCFLTFKGGYYPDFVYDGVADASANVNMFSSGVGGITINSGTLNITQNQIMGAVTVDGATSVLNANSCFHLFGGAINLTNNATLNVGNILQSDTASVLDGTAGSTINTDGESYKWINTATASTVNINNKCEYTDIAGLNVDGTVIVGNSITQPTTLQLLSGNNVRHEAGGLEANVSAYDGFPQIKAGATSNLKTNWSAGLGPTVLDDDTAGYSVGSMWIDTTADNVYQCVDASTGVAVWKQLDAGAGAIAIDNLTDASTNATSVVLGFKPTSLGANSTIVSKNGIATIPGSCTIVTSDLPASLTGQGNSIYGTNSAVPLTTGTNNCIYGTTSAATLSTGNNNCLYGYNSDVGSAVDGATVLGGGASCTANNSIALGSNASATIANAMNLPTALAQTTDATTTLLPMTFNTATGQVAPMNLTTASVGDVLTTTATGVEWAPGGGGGSGIISWGMARNSSAVTLTGTFTPISNWSGFAVSSDSQFTSTAAGITYIGTNPVYVKMSCTGLGMAINASTTNSLYFSIAGSAAGHVNNVYMNGAIGSALWWPISHSYIAQVSNGNVISFGGTNTAGTPIDLRELVLTVEKLEAPAGPAGPVGPAASAATLIYTTDITSSTILLSWNTASDRSFSTDANFTVAANGCTVNYTGYIHITFCCNVIPSAIGQQTDFQLWKYGIPVPGGGQMYTCIPYTPGTNTGWAIGARNVRAVATDDYKTVSFNVMAYVESGDRITMNFSGGIFNKVRDPVMTFLKL